MAELKTHQQETTNPIVLDKPDHWQLAFGPKGRSLPAAVLAALIVFLLAVVAEMWYQTQALHESLHSELRSSSLILGVFLALWLATLCLFGRAFIRRLRYFLTLESIEDISDRLGASQEELETQIRGQDIQPRYVANGRKHYDRKDLGDAATQLRGSAPPAEEQSLLIPVAAMARESENLVRPA